MVDKICCYEIDLIVGQRCNQSIDSMVTNTAGFVIDDNLINGFDCIEIT
ncbi:hypothetical protein [Candidatus Hodgkinia cicadicola]